MSSSNSDENVKLSSSPSSPKEAFLEWAKDHMVAIPSLPSTNTSNNDETHTHEKEEWLQAIASSIGNAKIVALSEGYHNCREMMTLHHYIIEYLVTHCGFNTIVSESGFPESHLIHNYILSNVKEEEESMWENGLNQMYSAWTEGRKLIKWMKHYNKQHEHKLHYYGLDIGGFYQNWQRPIEPILSYLQKVDPAYATSYSQQLKPYMEFMSTNARINYSQHMKREQQIQWTYWSCIFWLRQIKIIPEYDEICAYLLMNRTLFLVIDAYSGRKKDNHTVIVEHQPVRDRI
mmetsp:Transcript_23953/g.31824  ORF Transcript_23953/g.31824 Transcript_23953/m.31824 type:complete len:289 (+) Transcript_23953:172-1038(+)